MNSSITALETSIEQDEFSVNKTVALATCYLATNRPGDAVEMLSSTRDQFRERGANELWTFWNAQSLAFCGDTVKAREFVEMAEQTGDLIQLARIAILRAQAEQSGDLRPLAAYLNESLVSNDADSLYTSCDVMAQLGEWEYVSDRAESLVHLVNTAQAHRLAVVSSYNAKRFQQCLSLIDDYRTLYRHARIPNELRRMRMLSLQAMGALSKAVGEAEELTRKEPAADNFLALARLYFAKGDLHSVVIVAKRLAAIERVPSDHLLQMVQLCQFEAIDTAKWLWRKAVAGDLSDDAVTTAVSLGYGLGLDDEMKPVVTRMVEIGKSEVGSVKQVTLDEVRAVLRSQQDHAQKIEEAYNNGTILVHMISQRLRLPLVTLYHQRIASNSEFPDPAKQGVLFVRHGGRGIPENTEVEQGTKRLCLDVTAVLLAREIDVLHHVVEYFKPIWLPVELIPSLVEMRGQIRDPQPSRSSAITKVLSLVQDARVKVIQPEQTPRIDEAIERDCGRGIAELVATSRERDGLGVLREVPDNLPEDDQSYVVNCRSVVDSLHSAGLLPKTDYGAALSALGSAADEPVIATLSGGAMLFCGLDVLEQLAGADVLSVACDTYDLYIDDAGIQALNARERVEKLRRESDAWLAELVEYISLGIEEDSFRVLPMGDSQGRSADDGPTIGCLQTLMSVAVEEGDLVWVDDRFVNAHLRCGNAKLVGISEVLRTLRDIDRLDDDAYYSAILNLRLGNCRYIPITKNEILHHLSEATVRDDVIVENSALRALRRYTASCQLRPELIQPATQTKGAAQPLGEIRFFIKLRQAVTGALFAVWSRNEDRTTREAWCDWILTSLYTEHIRHIFGEATDAPGDVGRQDVATSISELLLAALEGADYVGPKKGEFLRWLEERVLRVKFEADPLLVAAVSETVKPHLTGVVEHVTKMRPQGNVYGLIQSFYETVPVVVRREFDRDDTFMAGIGLRIVERIEVAGFRFPVEEYWRAASEAVNGREATVKIGGHAEPAKFRPLQKSATAPGFRFRHPEAKKEVSLKGEHFKLLSESPSERGDALQRLSVLIDCNKRDLESLTIEIVGEENPRKRMDMFNTRRESSAPVFYHELLIGFTKTGRLDPSVLTPNSADGLMRFVRLDPQAESKVEFRARLCAGAEELANEDGIVKAIDRCWALPVPLPEQLVQAIVDMGEAERRKAVGALLANADSPISQVHLVRILLSASEVSPLCGRLARWAMHRWSGEAGVAEASAFLSVLSAIGNAFARWHDIAGWSAEHRLAGIWVHSHKVYSMLRSLGVDVDWIEEVFPRMSRPSSQEVFDREWAYWNDVSHPKNLLVSRFVLTAFDYIAQGAEGPSWLKGGIERLLKSAGTLEVDGQEHLTPDMLGIYVTSPDHLSSFLAADIGSGLSSLIPEDAERFSWSVLASRAQRSVQDIMEGRSVADNWFQLYAMIGARKPQEDLVEPIRALVACVDFVEIYKLNPGVGELTMMFCTHQLMHIPNGGLLEHIHDALIRLAAYLSEQGLDVDHERVSTENVAGRRNLLVLDAARNIALADKDKHPIDRLRETMAELTKAWPDIGPPCRQLVETLYLRLPGSEAERLWRTVIEMRSTQ